MGSSAAQPGKLRKSLPPVLSAAGRLAQEEATTVGTSVWFLTAAYRPTTERQGSFKASGSRVLPNVDMPK